MTPLSLPRGRATLQTADLWAAGAVTAGTLLLLLLTDGMGYTRDESYYFRAGREYGEWFVELWHNLRAGQLRESFTAQNIDRHWSYNPEHPVLVKTLFALSRLLFAIHLGWMDEATAMRLPGMVFGAGLAGLTWLLAREMTGDRLAATVAAISLLLLPRVFFHAHLACFDIPITFMWVAVVYAWWRAFDSRAWAWITGALWGLALITKLNAFFLPFVLLLHLAATRIQAARRGPVRNPWRPPEALVAMGILGPLIFLAGWPRHWFDTVNRIRWYIEFHLYHEHYYVDFFGRHFIEPPFPVSFPFVKTLATTPIVWLFAAAVGAIAWWRVQRRPAHPPDTNTPGPHLALRPTDSPVAERPHIPRAPGTLLLLNILIPFLIIARPETPIFGGIKHWMPALPFLSILAGVGVRVAADQLAPLLRGQRTAAAAIAATLLLAPVSLATVLHHPFGLAYYGEAVLGITGAADRGAMRNYWGYTSRQALGWLNTHAPENARVHFHHTTEGAVAEYRRRGWLRQDIVSVRNVDLADIVLYHHPKAVHARLNEHYVQQRFNTLAPVHTVTLAGVPLLSVYTTHPTTDPLAPDVAAPPSHTSTAGPPPTPRPETDR